MWLGIETATTHLVVSLFEADGRLMHQKFVEHDRNHAKNLGVLVADLLAISNDVEGVVISAGPGSYTGLRIGAAFAKGFCVAKQIPLLAVSTMASMAAGFIATHHTMTGTLIPVLDSRKDEVYLGVYDLEKNELLAPAPFRPNAECLPDHWAKPYYFFGSGVDKLKALNPQSELFIFYEDSIQYFKFIHQISSQLLYYKNYDIMEDFEPHYLKPGVFKD